MQTDRFLRVTLRDKFGNWQGVLGSYNYLSVTERWHAQGFGEIEVDSTNVKLPVMMTPGCRVFVEMMTGSVESAVFDGVPIMQGILRDPVLGFMEKDTVRFQITDDWRYLRNFLAWVRPELPLEVASLSDTGQSYDTASPAVGTDTGRTGYWRWPALVGPYPAEDAIDDFLGTHLRDRWVSEMGYPRFADMSSLGRGGDVFGILPQVRFGMLEDYVLPLLEASGLGMRFTGGFSGTILYDNTSWEFWEPRNHARVFAPDSGVIVEGTASLKYPTAMDIVVGGPGDQASRHFLGVDDATGMKETYADFIEVFREATGAPVEWPSTLDETLRVAKYYLLRPEVTTDQKTEFLKFMVDAGLDAQADGAPTSGVSLKIQESAGFKYTGIPANGLERGPGFATGDLMTVAPSGKTALSHLQFTDRITETTLTQTADNGLIITPVLGNPSESPDRKQAKAIRALFDAARRKNINQ